MSEEVFLKMAEECFLRLTTEIQVVSKQEIRITHIIINLFYVIKLLSDKMRILQNRGMKLPNLKAKLAQVLQYVDVSYTLGFNEDCMKAVNSFLFACSSE